MLIYLADRYNHLQYLICIQSAWKLTFSHVFIGIELLRTFFSLPPSNGQRWYMPKTAPPPPTHTHKKINKSFLTSLGWTNGREICLIRWKGFTQAELLRNIYYHTIPSDGFLKLYYSLVLYAKLTGDVHTFVFWLYLRDRVGFPLFI